MGVAVDASGAGDAGDEPGLALLPVRTRFENPKLVRAVTSECDGRRWSTYEIHQGRTEATAACAAFQTVFDGDRPRPDGHRVNNVRGTYQHGCFEAPESRRRLAAEAGIVGHVAPNHTWKEKRSRVYEAMADHVAAHADLGPIRSYLGL